MFWIVAVSVFAGMMLGTCLGILMLRLEVAPSRVSDQARLADNSGKVNR